MATNDRPTGPYAPVKNVLDVVHRLRDRGLPVPLTADSIQTLGIPPGNAPRTLQAVKFLGLIDGKGGLTEPAERIRRASTEEYPSLFAEIIRAAYVPVFQLVDPAEDGEVKIADAFRQYDPAGQREKMVTLFLGLCEEAAVVQKTERQSQRQAAPRRETPRPRRDAARTGHRSGGGTGDTSGGGGGSSITPAPPANLLFGVSEDDIGALDDTEFKSVWDALGVVARARARARQQREASVSEPEPDEGQ